MSLGFVGGLWMVWPGFMTAQGWDCTKDLLASQDEELTDYESFVEKLPSKIKLGLSLSPKALMKREKIQPMDKIRIVGDACFR